MRILYDLVDTRELTVTARAVLERERQNRLRQYLPFRNVTDIDYRFLQINRANHAASIRAFDTPAQRGRRPGGSERRGSLPAISEIIDLTESESLRLRRLVGDQNGLAGVVRENIFADAAIAAQSVANRLELLRGEVLSTGQISIDEGGVVQVIDYELPAELNVAAPVAWTDTVNADIIGDLFGWLEAYNDQGNDGAGVIVTSTRVLGLMVRNEGIQRIAYGPNASDRIVTPEALNQVLGAYGLPPVATYDRKVQDAAGVEQRVVAEDRLLFLPGTDDGGRRLGETQMGVTEEAVNAANEGPAARRIPIDEAPGLVAVTLKQDHPSLTATLATGIGLPVLQSPKRLLTADVF
jgi:hypothetical protein